MYEIELSRNAKHYYDRTDKNTARRLDECFLELEKGPFVGTRVKRLKGKVERFRYRVGGLRVTSGWTGTSLG